MLQGLGVSVVTPVMGLGQAKALAFCPESLILALASMPQCLGFGINLVTPVLGLGSQVFGLGLDT